MKVIHAKRRQFQDAGNRNPKHRYYATRPAIQTRYAGWDIDEGIHPRQILEPHKQTTLPEEGSPIFGEDFGLLNSSSDIRTSLDW